MIVTRDNIHLVAETLSQHQLKAADTETFGLGFEDSLFSIIAAAGEVAYYFNFKDYEVDGVVGLDLEDPWILRHTKEMFADPFATWFFHNAKFDLHKLRAKGIEVAGKIWDTKAHERVLRNNLLNYTLAALTKGQKYQKSKEVDEYIAEHSLKSKRTVEGKKKVITDLHFDQVDFPTISAYGCLDGLSTEEKGLSQMKEYESLPNLWRVRDNELELTKVIFEMESHGIMLNIPFVLAGWEVEKRLVRESEEAFHAQTGLHLKDTKKLTLVQLLRDAGETILLSEAGNPILDSDALELMRSPIAKLIQQVRYHEKRITAFYATFMQFRDSHNVIHANLDQAGTETGRMSMSGPNLHQLSKDGDETDIYPIRGCFMPRPGTCFVQFDYSQQEYRLLADYAKEMGLIEKIRAGYDVHRATAELVGVTRDEAKTINFAILYGAGAAKLALMLGISLMAARRLIDKYFAALPHVELFIERVKAAGRNRRYVFNWFGRICRITKSEYAYVLPNHLIQGSGADVCKVALVRIARLLREKGALSKLVLTVHDSIVLEMPPTEFYLLDEIKNIMESVYISKNGIILKTDMEWSFKSLAKAHLTKGDPRVQRIS